MRGILLTPTFEDPGALLEEPFLLDGLDFFEDGRIIHFVEFVIIVGKCYIQRLNGTGGQLRIIMFMADNPLNQSHDLYEGERLDNNHINNTLLDEQTTIHSQSELMDDPSRIEYPNEEERKNDSNDKSLHVDIAFDRNLDNKEIKAKKHHSHLRGFLKDRQRQILTFHCFGDKKIDLSKDDIGCFIRRKFDDDVKNVTVSASIIVEEVIRKLCMSEFGFEPCMVKVESFNLVGIEVDAEGKREVAAGNATLQGLYKFESLIVTRVKRVVELNKYYTQLQERSKELEILQILSPDQRDLVEVIERGRTYGQLKEKLLSYYYQMVGKVILVSYHSFKVLENKRKIGDIPDKIIEIYQEKTWQFEDNTFRKRNIVTSVASFPCLVAAEEHSPTTTEELLINDSLLKGSLYLQVRKNQLIERFHGGFLGYLGADRITPRSLMTITAIKIVENSLYLQFKFKAGSEIVTYDFSSRALLTQVLNAVLAVVRKYQHRVQVMQ